MLPRHENRFDPILFTLACLCAPALVFAAPIPVDVQGSLPQEWRNQYVQLQEQLQRRDAIYKLSPQTFRPDSLVLPEDRDPADIVIRRTAALLGDLQSMPGAHGLSAYQKTLSELQARNKNAAIENSQARYALYADACRLRREVAFSNPLLDFDKLLFVTHHRSIAPNSHMCDQYYGCFAEAGGGTVRTYESI